MLCNKIKSIYFFHKITSKRVFLAFFLYMFSVNCSSDSRSANSFSVGDRQRYECGKECVSIERVVFELRANADFYNNSEDFSKKMKRFETDFKEEFIKLRTSHKIDFKSAFRITSFDPRYSSQKSALLVYINISKDQCSASGVSFDVVTLEENEMSFDKLKCESLSGSCFDNKILDVFQRRVIRKIANPVLQPVQY